MILFPIFLLLIILIIAPVQLYQSELFQCHGSWTQSDNSSTIANRSIDHIQSYINFNNYGDLSDFAHSLIQMYDVCPFEELIFNCAYRNVTQERRSRIENRIWTPHNNVNTPGSSCQDFDPKKFLSLLVHRTLIFLGDSLSYQTWSNLVCSLSRVSRFDPESTKVAWKYNELVGGACPLGKFHCHLNHGTVFFPEYNATIAFRAFVNRKSENATFTKLLETYKLGKSDIFVCNFGLWNQDAVEYRQLMVEYLEDIRELQHTAHAAPHVLFLETFPQHFSTTNGYFNRTDPQLWWAPCKPLPLYNTSYDTGDSDSQRAQRIERWREVHDWRNTVARDEIAKSGVSIDVVSLAEGLYSQWDAHVDLIEVHTQWDYVHAADCTHYCSHAAVFQYVKSTLQHVLIALQNRHHTVK